VGVDTLNGGDEAQWDVAAVYARDAEAVRIRAAAGYARRADDTNRLSGSVSALHRDRPQPHARRRRAGARRRRRPLFRLRQAGLDRKDPVRRPTSFSIDVYGGDSVSTGGSESVTVGLAAVQPVKRLQTDFYATLRWYDYDDSAADYEDGIAFLTGARFSF
jgi:hypothetical protein